MTAPINIEKEKKKLFEKKLLQENGRGYKMVSVPPSKTYYYWIH
jgi:hypothetical protein